MHMEYMRQPNLLLEAFSFLGRKANGNTWEELEQQIQKRNIPISQPFRHIFSKLKELTEHVNSEISFSDELLHKLFDNLEGMPYNTIGSGSPAFLLFYSGLEKFHGNLDEFIDEMKVRTPAQVALDIALALDLAENNFSEDMEPMSFVQQILAQSFPDKTKLAILNLYTEYPDYVEEAGILLRPLLQLLEQEQETLFSITADFDAEIQAVGCEQFFGNLSHFKPDEKTFCILRPFLFGMDTNLSSDIAPGKICIYCGILRKALQEMINSRDTSDNSVYEAFRLLGDRTRFDILCYLRDHDVYSQELCAHFNLSRNTIHHHMTKLIAGNLVQCSIEGNRLLYSLNPDTIRFLLKEQEKLFCKTEI